MNLNRLVLLSVVFAFLGTEVNAQWIQTNGPIHNNKTGSLAVSGANLYAGTDSGGVFVSTNSGAVWSTMNVGLTEHYVWALGFSSTTFFAGTSGGLFLSTNNGASWSTPTTGVGGVGVSALTFSGTKCYAGTNGGVYLSTNGGTVWKTAKAGLTDTQVRALAFIDTSLFAGTLSGGVFLSTNSGTLWNAVNTNLGNTSVSALAVSGTKLFAGTGNGVFLSTDRGTSWTSVSTGLENEGSIYALILSGSNLFAATWMGNVFMSTNNGTTWNSVSTGLTGTGPLRAFAIAGTNLVVGATNNGVWRRPLSEMTPTSVGDLPGDIPSAFSLAQNYPNPFNPSTLIRYGLPNRAYVTLTVFNTLGQQVAILQNAEQEAGYHEVKFDGSSLSSGVCFYRIEVRPLDSAIGRDSKSGAGSFVQTRKLLLIR